MDFTTGKCGYKFTGTASKTATSELTCAVKGGSVKLTPTIFGSSLCTITIAPQLTGGHVTFHAGALQNGKTTVTAEATASGIASSRTGSSLCGPESSTTGTYTGNSLLTGYEDLGPAEGAQVNISVS